LGKYFVETIMNRDYMMIMGTTIFLAMLVIIANFIVDILYRIVDPRIELQ
jgi:oligopeptide transport system permease protein